MTIWFLSCGVIVLIIGGVGLRLLLKPLVLLERQADALCRKKYEIQKDLPKTKELRRVFEAMNRMTSKVREMFEEQVAITEGLRTHAYFDTLTGLGNRRYFESQITARLDQQEGTTQGVLLLVQINKLHELNQQKGFQAGDDLLKRVGALLQEATKPYENALLARLTGGDFGIFLPDGTFWNAESIAETVSLQLRQAVVEKLTLTDNVGHVGAVSYESATTLGRMLSEADLALRSAQQAGSNKWTVRNLTEETGKMPLGQQQWKNTIEQALSERRIILFAQPVVNTYDRNIIIHLEVFSRIVQDDGEFLNAGVFMPFTERLFLVSTLDRIALEDVMQLDAAKMGVERVAVNVSAASIQDDVFRRWLLFSIENLPIKAPRINFEFSELGAVQHLEIIKDFSSVARKHGHLVGLDHYGQSFSHLGYLKSLRPDYVKIDKAYTGELKDAENDSRFFIGCLCSVAHSLDITVIAEGVETEQQWQLLKELNLDAIQGYLIDRPKPLIKETR
jgi:diguanylate cyclase (GGDEF)-like protein